MDMNRERQIEEIEALTSIYEDLFELENENSFVVRIEEGTVSARLSVQLNNLYPSEGPPIYTLSAPFLSTLQKQELTNILDNIYLDNLGEPIVFLWTEEIRTFLQNLDLDENTSTSGCDTKCDDVDVLALQDLHIKNESSKPTVDCPEIYTTDVFEDRKSVFQGHCATVTSLDEIKAVLNKLYENKKIAHATHNMYAYRIHLPDKNSWLQDCDDDGESAAGGRMLHLLEIVEAKNTLVVVSRWYGGIQLGPDRFKHINNMTRRALEESGALKQEKPSGGKKKKK
eukprot:TRINITY_DN13572_c0_g1_i21.p1 TRINITY_DN13572_c0_g1~~TRINITY_DN13572_c0_g1_i21.p1  ORF type:complete len:284 (-),score=43.03 TRINITY_DN13572_c0_g1_i21:367-1218(-)